MYNTVYTVYCTAAGLVHIKQIQNIYIRIYLFIHSNILISEKTFIYNCTHIYHILDWYYFSVRYNNIFIEIIKMEIYTTQVMIIIVSLFNLIINIQPILSQEHCNDGDHVCKLIKMHTSGFLTYDKLENVTRTLDTTLQRAIGLEINVATLNTQVTQESQLGTEMRVRLENEAKNREVEINKVLKGLAKSFNRTKVLQKQSLTSPQGCFASPSASRAIRSKDCRAVPLTSWLHQQPI